VISIEALAQHGLSNKTLRRVFESKAPEASGRKKVPTQKSPGKGAPLSDGQPGSISGIPYLTDRSLLPADVKDWTDWDRNCYLTSCVRAESQEGMMRCAGSFDIYSAMDLAYSSIPIHPLVPDLMKAAMGHVSIAQCEESVGRLSAEWKNKLFERDARGKAIAVNQPKLIEVSHNLVNSLTTRRVAALATEVYQQFPLLKYDPFSNNQTGRLVADVMTQLAEQMAGAYGYRHDYEESIRQASLYTTSIKFKSKHWHTEKQTLPVLPPPNGATNAGKPARPIYERKIVREGVEFVTPHPSRVFYDISKPLSKLNNDLGPRWIGYWDVVPIGTVRSNPAYFNKDAILMDAQMFSVFTNNPAYFSQYYPEQINVPPTGARDVGSIALQNDRVANIGVWAQMREDISTVLTEHYRCVIPKDVGLGTYPDPVWIRFVMAATTTIIYAEIVGSAPASVNSYNASDGLLMSPSFGMQAIQWQQMLTNQLNMLVHAQYQSMVEIWALNKDGMEKAHITAITNQLKNPDFTHIANTVITYSQEKLAQIGQQHAKGADRLSRIVIESSAKINEIFNSMVQTLALAERLMFFSPQELGQVSPRTVTATEMKAVRDTTLGIRDFHLVGVKQQIDADKRIIHDSYMAFGSDELEVPVAERFDPKVIAAAGFEIVDDGTGAPPDGLFTIKGKKLGLLYNYTYTTRNTDDTPPDAVVAQGLAQIYEILTKDTVLGENTTVEQRFELANSLFDKIAPGVFKLRVPDGTDPKKTVGGEMQKVQQQMQQALPQIGQALQQLAAKQAEQDAKIAQNDAGVKALADAINALVKSLAPKPPKLTAAPAGPATPGGGQNAPGTPINGTTPRLAARQPRPVPILGQ
jgi:hypothetical protein